MDWHVLGDLKLLVQIGMGDPAFPNDLAFVRLKLADDDVQNSGLARTIASD